MYDTSKITPNHLNRLACLYVRQSSLQQVHHNKESQRRQYDLRHRAMDLGWSMDQIHVIDEDQGMSGATSLQRTGFQDLRARVGAGEVGIILCLEVSRICRDSAEWQQLLKIASITDTLILDEYGVYSSSYDNDWFLLGIKGHLSEFELRGIRHRLIQGQRNKAQRGALKLALPVGLVYTDTDQVVKDPDPRVREAIEGVFRCFDRLKSSTKVVQWLMQHNLRLPARMIGASPHWNPPTPGRVLHILRNPRYAGCYVYGRRKREQLPDETFRMVSLPMEQWRSCIPDAHEGYIAWEDYLQNQQRLQSNGSRFLSGKERLRSPRSGQALLSSRVLCGVCGHQMQVIYASSKTRGQIWYYVCKDHGGSTCQSVRGEVVDTAVSDFMIAAINQENLALSLKIQQQLRMDFEEADRQRQNHLAELSDHTELARRRFMEVDPSNRRVAATLERQWESRLEAYEDAVKEREKAVEIHQNRCDRDLDEKILALAKDFSQVWKNTKTTNENRKRLLGSLMDDVTLIRNERQVEIKIRLRGGKTQELDPVSVHVPHAWVLRRDATPESLAELETLLEEGCTDHDAAQTLNQCGHLDSRGEPFTKKSIQRIRMRHGMENGLTRKRNTLRQQGYQTGHELASELGMTYEGLRVRSQSDETIKVQQIQSSNRTYFMYKYSP